MRHPPLRAGGAADGAVKGSAHPNCPDIRGGALAGIIDKTRFVNSRHPYFEKLKIATI